MTPSLLNNNSHGKKACFSGVCCPILSQESDLSHLENNLIKSFDYREDAGVRRYHSLVLRFCQTRYYITRSSFVSVRRDTISLTRPSFLLDEILYHSFVLRFCQTRYYITRSSFVSIFSITQTGPKSFIDCLQVIIV